MKQVLIPHPIAKKCFLIEALYWVAFKLYPLYYGSRKGGEWDTREDFTSHDDDAEFIYTDLKYFFTKENCERYGLPINPRAKYLDSGAIEPMSIELIEKILKNKKEYSKETRAEALKNKSIAIEYKAAIENWKECLADYLELSKASIFSALKNGKITASGQKIGKLKKKVSISQWENKENWDNLKDWYNVKRSDIPKEFWRIEGIDWDDGSAFSPSGYYTSILLDTDELFAVFPEPKPERINIRSINGTLLLDEDAQLNVQQAYARRGRPSCYNWEEFIVEMVKRDRQGSLPKTQKACVIEMKQWCKECWGREPSETNLKDHISRFYQAKIIV
ncbi:MAG: hypothetical protein A2X77_04430 [Gammaproteobacteria bacterium GWE2_42_36]|nr:MAG: hypothetical protein A2X77_04430 [Gammaproteobacteria bacterium GWE2_42_36]